MCGTSKSTKEDGQKDQDSEQIAYAAKRAKLLKQGQQSWIKRMDEKDKKIRWVRSYALNSSDIDKQPLRSEELKRLGVRVLKARLKSFDVDVSTAVSKSDLIHMFMVFYDDIPTISPTKLKSLLRCRGIDESKCVEKSDLVQLVRQSVHCDVRGKFDGWIRSFDRHGKLSWIPANEWCMDAEVRIKGNRSIATIGELRSASVLSFKQKLAWFRRRLASMRTPWASGHQKLRVRRDHLLEDAYGNFRMLKPSDFWQIFRFEFIGEPAVDAGGVAREWFSEVGRAVFNIDFGLFTYGDVDNLCYQINAHSGLANENHLEYFRFVGRLLGKALFDQQLIAAHLNLPMYKHILGWPIMMRDLEFVNRTLCRSLTQVMNVDDAEELMLDFTTTDECFGKITVIPLKKGGEDVDVTNDNKHEYVKLMLKHHMFDRVKTQLSQLLQGFYEVIPPALVSVFDFQELELLINGLPQIDVIDWEQSTTYQGEFHADHPVVKWFWETVGQMKPEMLSRLLQFSTGTSRVPVQGFQALQSKDGKLTPFTLKSVPLRSTTMFPIAHTCFNRIDLPVYKSAEDLKRNIAIAVQMEATGFSIE